MPRTLRPALGIGLALTLLSIPLLADEPREPAEDARRAFREARLEALSYDTVSALPPSPRTVVAPSTNDLAIDGHFDLGGYVFKDGIPFVHNDGGATNRNTALGLGALISLMIDPFEYYYGFDNTALGFEALANTTEGYSNTASGSRALYSNTMGSDNTAGGDRALYSNVGGSFNTASGSRALYSNTNGNDNTATGSNALESNTGGGSNVAIGSRALESSTTSFSTGIGAGALQNADTGARNTALGRFAGGSNVNGSNSIWIANYGTDESNTLRIGAGTGTGNFEQNRAFISGIHNASISGTAEHTVCVDDTDQLGVCTVSSARFKHDVRAMGEASAGIEDLRPVVFKYRPEVKQDAETEHFGLIAEEVAEVYPHLVTTDAEGRPFTVRYDLLTPLLLNELQAQQRQVVALEARLRRLETVLAAEP